MRLFAAIFIILAVSAQADQLPTRRASWRNLKTIALVTTQGSPRHNAQDAITNPGAPVTVSAKFVYGRARKDLEDEEVSLWVKQGKAWQKAGRTLTDSDGRASIEAPGYLFQRAGEYEFRMIVSGDLTTAPGKVFVVRPGARLVTFDIDGTLTTNEIEALDEMLGGVTDVRPDAATTARVYSRAGVQVLYLTGRPNLMIETTRRWLRERGFPSGAIRTTDRILDGLPTPFLVQRYKREVLQDLRWRADVELFAAYGNSGTDLCAYANAGVETRRTFILGSHSGSACPGHSPTRLIQNYTSHLPTAREIISER